MQRRKVMNVRHIGNYASYSNLDKAQSGEKFFEPNEHGKALRKQALNKSQEFKMGETLSMF